MKIVGVGGSVFLTTSSCNGMVKTAVNLQTAFMKYTAWIFFLLTTMAMACKKSDKADCPTDSYIYTFLNGAKLDTVKIAGVPTVTYNTGGNKKVFIYKWAQTACPGIADADKGHTLLFEVDPALSHFKYPVDSFRAIRCSFCPYAGYGFGQPVVTPTSGTIEGTKLNDSQWKLIIDVTINASQSLKVEHGFNK
jgi:hypothetical protein